MWMGYCIQDENNRKPQNVSTRNLRFGNPGVKTRNTPWTIQRRANTCRKTEKKKSAVTDKPQTAFSLAVAASVTELQRRNPKSSFRRQINPYSYMSYSAAESGEEGEPWPHLTCSRQRLLPGAPPLVLPLSQCSAPNSSYVWGFVYRNSRASPDSIFIGVLFDPVCSDSRDAWPPPKQSVDHYGFRLSIIVHPFALLSVTINPPLPLAMRNYNCQLDLCDIHESNWQVL